MQKKQKNSSKKSNRAVCANRRVQAPKPNGKFIVLEGIDGSGTTTQSRLLADWLIDQGHRAVVTCEPSNGPIGHLLRQVLSGRVVGKKPDGRIDSVTNDVIALLFAADRLDHLDNEILPLLRSGVFVISDRYYHSSLTYQALTGDLDWISVLNQRALVPDVTYLLEVPASTAAGRRRRVRAAEDLYETDATQEQLVIAYRDLPQLLRNETIVLMDGAMNVKLIHDAMVEDLMERFNIHRSKDA